MPGDQFEIFRARCHSTQRPLLFQRESPSDLLARLLRSRPRGEIRRGHTWRVASIIDIQTPRGMYFQFGRITRATQEHWNEESEAFVDVTTDLAPYTHCILDLDDQVLGISYRRALAPNVRTVARRLQKLLNSLPPDQRWATIEIAPISDPRRLLDVVQRAHSIHSFESSIFLPNPIDAEELIQAPLERAVESIRAQRGAVRFTGRDLNREEVERQTRAAAAAGSDASARVRMRSGQPIVRHKLRDNIMSLRTEQDPKLEARSILENLRQLYRNLRGTL